MVPIVTAEENILWMFLFCKAFSEHKKTLPIIKNAWKHMPKKWKVIGKHQGM